ncbi:MAG: hypothetical protein IT287_00325, partial [Bdellovibrionaceae bacterium]|nr:hypothetical protein [Pseudobdellovibrionaceae bacterium]
MTKYKFTLEQVFYGLLALVVTVAFCHLASVCYFADSEIWLLTLSQQTFSGNQLTSILYKWSFHATTYLFSHCAPAEVDVYLYARYGWMVIALCSQVILAYTFSLFANNKKLFLPLFLALMTFSAFFNQGFRIRGDTLSLFAHSLILLFLFQKRNAKIKALDFALLFALNLVLALSTPKSLYFFIAQFLFALSIYKNITNSKPFFVLVWTTHLLPVVGLLGLALLTVILPLGVDLMAPLQEAMDYYIKSFDNTLFNATFFSVVDFGHVLKAFAKSPIHAIIFLLGSCLYLYSSFASKQKTIYTSLNIYFGVLALFVVFHNQKFPFFLGTFGAPLIAYTTLLTWNLIEKVFKTYSKFLLIIAWGSMMFLCLYQYGHNLFYNNNVDQLIAVKTLENYIDKHPSLSHYDIIGLLPRKTKIFLFVGPGEISRKKAIIEELAKQDPDVIIFTYKFVYLEPEIQHYLTKNRISVEHNVWLKGDSFSVTNATNYFRTQISINNNYYWKIPHPPRNYIYDVIAKKQITNEVLP